MLRLVQLEGELLIADVRRPAFDHAWVEHERLAGATIAITNKVPIDAASIAALPELKMIAISATGTNNVDLGACRERGIVVSNIRGYAGHTVPEHVMALLLALSRNLVAWRESLQAGGWQRSEQFRSSDP